METFIIIGMCFLCYELCEFLYQCNPRKKEENTAIAAAGCSDVEEKHAIYTISECQVPNADNVQ